MQDVQEEDSCQQQIALKFKEETSEVLHLRAQHCMVLKHGYFSQ